MSDKAVITCSLNGLLTDPKQHHVPVTPEEMAREAKATFDAGASVMHIHLRQQAPNKGHLPSWEVNVSREIQQAIREACPGVIINHTTGTSGPNYSGALDCVRETRPEMAACNAGSLNFLKVKSDNTWAWQPMQIRGQNRRKSPAARQDIPVFRRSAFETAFDRGCVIVAAAWPARYQPAIATFC